MATLNTLRTKFGIVLSVIIALALLAFILSLRTEMGFSGNNPKVGEIAGDKITYAEYYDEYEVTKSQNGGDAYDETAEERISAGAWQSLIARHAMTPGFEKLGLGVTDAERMSMLSGEHPSPVYYSLFANPMTGEYDAAGVAQFLAEAENDPRISRMWDYINSQAVLNREITKYAGLVRGGAYVNSLEVGDGVHNANNTFSGRVVSCKYTTVADSLFTISNSELKRYYNEHKGSFKQQPSRSISYVLFDVDPTPEDMAAIENEVNGLASELAVTTNVRDFFRQNRRGSVDEVFSSREMLSGDEAEALMSGRMYGPVLENDVWKIYWPLDTRSVPDSLGLRRIVLSYNSDKLADSLMTAFRSGADFADAARRYSIVETDGDGGEIGVLPFSVLPLDFAEALSSAKSGDVVKIASGNAIQIVKVYRADKPSKHVRLARIEYPVEASAATLRAVHNTASTFAVKAKGSEENFSAAAAEASVTPRVAVIGNSDRTVRGLDKSHEIVRWAYGAEKGDVSEIFKVGKDYAVAILTEIDNSEYRSLKSVEQQIRTALLRDKKYDYILSGMNGSDIDSVAESFGSEVSEFSDVSYASYYINGVGFEPRLVGAIAATAATGELSAPVKGTSGVYLFVVDNIADSASQTTEAERVRLQAAAESMAQQASLFAVQELAAIKDMRSRYF